MFQNRNRYSEDYEGLAWEHNTDKSKDPFDNCRFGYPGSFIEEYPADYLSSLGLVGLWKDTDAYYAEHLKSEKESEEANRRYEKERRKLKITPEKEAENNKRNKEAREHFRKLTEGDPNVPRIFPGQVLRYMTLPTEENRPFKDIPWPDASEYEPEYDAYDPSLDFYDKTKNMLVNIFNKEIWVTRGSVPRRFNFGWNRNWFFIVKIFKRIAIEDIIQILLSDCATSIYYGNNRYKVVWYTDDHKMIAIIVEYLGNNAIRIITAHGVRKNDKALHHSFVDGKIPEPILKEKGIMLWSDQIDFLMGEK